MKLSELAKRLGCPLEGSPEIEITGVAGLEEATSGQISFYSHRRYRHALRQTRASAVIIPMDEPKGSFAALRSPMPYVHMARAIEILMHRPSYPPGMHPTAVVARTAEIGQGSHIGPYCFVGEGTRIGRNAVLHSFVSIYAGVEIGDDFFAHSHAVVREGCHVGDRVRLQNGVVLGSDGFAFAPHPDGFYEKVWPTGAVEIGDDVEIQSNSGVDRPTTGQTVIEKGVKIDSLSQVGHSCHVGENSILCSQVGLAGSVRIGKNCILAGQAGVADHFSMGDGSILSAQSGLGDDVPSKSYMSGSPAVPSMQWKKNVAALNYLPELLRTVRRLEAELEGLRRGEKSG